MSSDNQQKKEKASYMQIQRSINEWTFEQQKVVFDILNGIGYGKKENEDKAKTNISNQNKNSESEVLNVSE
jgi:hypothetical protein